MDFTYLKNFMDELVDKGIPGNGAIVYKDGKKVFEYASGYASIEEKTPMSTNIPINIYSCSKPMTVVAALQLFEQGKFLLSDPLYNYIPEFSKVYIKDENGNLIESKKPITMWNLFTMTSGYDYSREASVFEKAREITAGKMDTVQVIKCLAKQPLLFEPGEHWQYGLSHDILAAAVEVISGMRFADYVKKNIFNKLEMDNSYYHKTPEIEAKMAEQYKCVTDSGETDIVNLQKSAHGFDGEVVNIGKDVVIHGFGENYDSGGAGIITTIEDYSKFVAALASGGMGLNGERILSPATVELLHTNQLSEEQMAMSFNWPQLAGYGYGLGVRTMIDKAKGGSNGNIGEFGWGGAAGATVLADTKENLAVFYAHHMLNPHEEYYQPRLRNVVYSCID